MPIFKNTQSILKTPWEDTLFNPNWMDSDTPYAPPSREWTYDRPMTIEDVDIWEQLHYQTGAMGVYASWSPYAEFYLITLPWCVEYPNRWETFYGPQARLQVYERAKQLGIDLAIGKIWVEDHELWKYKESVPTSDRQSEVSSIIFETVGGYIGGSDGGSHGQTKPNS